MQALKKDFSDYHQDPQQFPFLHGLQADWQAIREEFSNFMAQSSAAEQSIAAQMMGPQSKTIRTKGAKKYSAFGILFQGRLIDDYIRTYQIGYPDCTTTNAASKVQALRETYFPKLTQVVTQVNQTNANILRNVYFGTFHPGLDIRLHTNDNPHMYRGYLGLIVPKGDVAMKICHDKLHWHEGEFMVLDHSYPHCPHNHTDYDRTVLVVDFFKPDKPREEVIEFEQIQVAQRMQANLYSLGVFGQSDKASEADFVKYGLAHQLEWDKALGS
ncbi:aspartyl/asparaginyl beta-hydroxylase domain-containing protein [Leptolyngbyaceae cyanobacterium CCMR0082]|uniref:Aspartyl/asparaginyl beta-hydroxylase domain-containing protein n=1 Tax=Adonisia turfae CCMR0082 TaxID=2304604 RepID=A0A6M0RYL7_9CYAN|nr:aspartyl/asparaginyl beta-hydroxylase domain-containing protein [Adonisia turfae]NEZ61307.1 aspartyl/asparaginyl beta-hydroxylase domain-containing protein [Adonisia turfae CCMR0082]